MWKVHIPVIVNGKMEVRRIHKDEIRLEKTCDAFPEQYDAYDTHGNTIGYVRVRWGWCAAWCPDSD